MINDYLLNAESMVKARVLVVIVDQDLLPPPDGPAGHHGHDGAQHRVCRVHRVDRVILRHCSFITVTTPALTFPPAPWFALWPSVARYWASWLYSGGTLTHRPENLLSSS